MKPPALQISKFIPWALGLITLILFLPTIRHDFIAYDDQQYVYENFHVRSGLSLAGLKWAFGYHAGNWHPLTWLSHMLDCQLFGLKPGGHHLTSALLQTANTVLLFLLLNVLTGAAWRSACVAALFGWHPLHVESVAWVAERKDVLCAFFFLLTLLAYMHYARAGSQLSGARRRWFGIALVMFALALMSKPMAVTLPFVLLLMDYWPLKRFSLAVAKPGLKTVALLVAEKIPFLILSATVCTLTVRAQEQAIVSTAGLQVSQRIAHAVLSYAHYLGAMFWPKGLAVYYPYETAASPPQLIAATAVLLGVTLIALRFIIRWPWLAVGWFWYLGTLVPVIGLVQVGDQAWADRYTYLPFIGLFIVLVWWTAQIIQSRTVLQTTSALALITLLVLTTVQLRHWQNTRTLFTHAEQVTRNNHMAITMLASLELKEGRLDAAIERCQAALQLKPGYPEAHFFLGNALDQQGKLEAAVAEYNRVLWFKPLQAPTHLLLGAALGRLNRPEDAAAHYQTALQLDPDSALAHNNLARLRHSQGKLDEAIEHYRAAVKLDPALAQAHNNFGILLLQQGMLGEGTTELRESLRLNPTNAESQFNLALALNQQSQWKEAAELFQQTVGKAFNDANAHCQFALALAHLDQTREAMAHYATALLAQPDFADALDGLSWILATDARSEFRNGAEAVRMATRACELTGRKDAVKLKTLAAAYAESGNFTEAVKIAQEAQQVAQAADRKHLAEECGQLLENFKTRKPWRQTFQK